MSHSIDGNLTSQSYVNVYCEVKKRFREYGLLSVHLSLIENNSQTLNCNPWLTLICLADLYVQIKIYWNTNTFIYFTLHHSGRVEQIIEPQSSK